MTGRVALRPARLTDAWRLYKWRTDPVTVAMMAGPPPRSFLSHIGWLIDVLYEVTSYAGAPRRRLYVAHSTAVGVRVPIGTVRLDVDTHLPEAQVSLTVAPDVRGYGFAACIIVAALREAQRLGIARCWADVKGENEASLRAFTQAGFCALPSGHRDGFTTLTFDVSEIWQWF